MGCIFLPSQNMQMLLHKQLTDNQVNKKFIAVYVKHSNAPDTWRCQSGFIPSSTVFAIIKEVLLIFLNSTSVFSLLTQCSAGTLFKITESARIFQVEILSNYL